MLSLSLFIDAQTVRHTLALSPSECKHQVYTETSASIRHRGELLICLAHFNYSKMHLCLCVFSTRSKNWGKIRTGRGGKDFLRRFRASFTLVSIATTAPCDKLLFQSSPLQMSELTHSEMRGPLTVISSQWGPHGVTALEGGSTAEFIPRVANCLDRMGSGYMCHARVSWFKTHLTDGAEMG